MRFRTLALSVLIVSASAAVDASPRRHHHTHSLMHRAEWAGAGVAAGAVAGPAGSAGVGAAKYRHDLEAGGHRRTRAMVKIGAPIAAGVVAGPAGSAAYEAYDHRKWIKRHVLHTGHHHRHA
jgi:hypothetical protein